MREAKLSTVSLSPAVTSWSRSGRTPRVSSAVSGRIESSDAWKARSSASGWPRGVRGLDRAERARERAPARPGRPAGGEAQPIGGRADPDRRQAEEPLLAP